MNAEYQSQLSPIDYRALEHQQIEYADAQRRQRDVAQLRSSASDRPTYRGNAVEYSPYNNTYTERIRMPNGDVQYREISPQYIPNFNIDKYGDFTKEYISKYTTSEEKSRIPIKDEIDKRIDSKKEEITMAFGARVVDKKWYLCLRKGRLIEGSAYPTGDPKDWIDFIFKNQKVAKACADELNAKYWDSYKNNMEVMDGLDTAEAMINTIKGYLK